MPAIIRLHALGLINADCCNKLLITPLRKERAGAGPVLFHMEG